MLASFKEKYTKYKIINPQTVLVSYLLLSLLSSTLLQGECVNKDINCTITPLARIYCFR